MLTRLGSGEIKYEGNKIVKHYHCNNGAYHDGFCCDTCWNRHPDEKLHLGMLGTDKAFDNYNKYYKGDDKIIVSVTFDKD